MGVGEGGVGGWVGEGCVGGWVGEGGVHLAGLVWPRSLPTRSPTCPARPRRTNITTEEERDDGDDDVMWGWWW